MKIGIFYDTSKAGLGWHGVHCAFRGLPGIERIALADSNLNGLEKRMTETGAAVHYSDYSAMLDAEKPDILVLASRLPGDHIQPFAEAAGRGIHIFAEKPLCATLEEADRMAELAAENHIRVAVAHPARYAQLFHTMKKMIESGAIGTPLTVYGRGKEDYRGGGEDMLVLGTHILDLMSWLFGKVEFLWAEVRQNGQLLKPDDRVRTAEDIGAVAGDDVFAHFRFANGVRGIFESRKDIYQEGNEVRMGVTVVGTAGALSMRYTNESAGPERVLRLTRSSYPAEDAAGYEIVPLEAPPEIPGAEPLVMAYPPYFSVNNRLAAWDLMQAIREERSPAATVGDVQNVLELIQGIYLSSLEGRRISLPLQQRKHPLGE